MSGTTISREQFEQNPGAARSAAESGPVFITEGDRAAHVLLTAEHYRALTTRPGHLHIEATTVELDMTLDPFLLEREPEPGNGTP